MSAKEPSNSKHGSTLPGLDSLGVPAVGRVLKHLTGTQCAQLACLSRTFRAAANDDELWDDYYRKEYPNQVYQRERKLVGLRETGRSVVNFRYLYASKGQAKSFWIRVESWKNNEFNGLREGASEMALQAADQLLGFPLPLNVKEVYRRHNGQNSTRETRSVDVESIIKNFVNVPWWHLPSKALVNDRVFVALPLFLDLEKALSNTVDIRRYFFLMSRYSNYRETVGRNLKSKHGWTVARDVVFSSIAFAKLNFQSLTQFLLLKCDTYEVYLFEYPSLLVQIPTKSMYDWFVPWIEGYTGFDESGRPCELPLSWYFVKDDEKVLQLQGEDPNKIKELLTFREVIRMKFCLSRDPNVFVQCTICESNRPLGLPLESNEAFIGANPCSILSRISGGLVCNISTRIRALSDALIINYNAFEIIVSLYFTPLIADEAKAEDLKGQSLKHVIALKPSSHQGQSCAGTPGFKQDKKLLYEDTMP